MTELYLDATFGEETEQILKEMGGLRDDAERLESRIATLSERPYSVGLELNDDGELVVTLEDA